MDRQNTNRICATVPVILSLMACVWVLGNVGGGAKTGAGEGLGFKIFWLLILTQAPFALGYLATADWNRKSKVATSIVIQVTALILAFSPVAFFQL